MRRGTTFGEQGCKTKLRASSDAPAIYQIFTSRAKRAGVKFFIPHDLRRTYVSHRLDAGVDIATVAKMAGHSNIQTTTQYDRGSKEAKQRAASLLNSPYSGRRDKHKNRQLKKPQFAYGNPSLRN